MKNKTVLIILDGFGYNKNTVGNPLNTMHSPCIDSIFQNYPQTLLTASGGSIGLPKKQMGNSEVGHMHIGAGREILQGITRINKDIKTGEFFRNPIILDIISQSKKKGVAIHVVGLLSPGGVHSHEQHIQAFVDLLIEKEVKNYYLHAILDGRDTPPKSAEKSIKKFRGNISSITGRYYAMDRDKRWARTKEFYDLLVHGKCNFYACDPETALEISYARGETDEFIQPTSISSGQDSSPKINKDDVVFFMNFRSDRVKQISYALQKECFLEFERCSEAISGPLFTLTKYADDIEASVVFSPVHIKNTIGGYISKKKLRQLRLAETEKYAHVTYFFNGGRDAPFEYEDRVLINSKKVRTYDLKPEMSAFEITESLINAIKSYKYDLIICNYANLDMVGHTGLYVPAEKAISAIDKCLEQVIDEIKVAGHNLVITSDHGNIESMYDKKTRQMHTSHTTNLVPLIYIGENQDIYADNPSLKDIAPTVLYLLNVDPPKEMTGKSIIKKKTN